MATKSRKFIFSETVVLAVVAVSIVTLISSFFFFRRVVDLKSSITASASGIPKLVFLEVFLEQENNTFSHSGVAKKITFGQEKYESSDNSIAVKISQNQLAKVEVDGYFSDFVAISPDIPNYTLKLYKKTLDRFSMLNAGNTNLGINLNTSLNKNLSTNSSPSSINNSTNSSESEANLKQSLASVRSLFENTDVNTINLESVLIKDKPKDGQKNVANADRVKVLGELGIDFAALGNNNLYNLKEDGIKQTESVLSNANIGFAGSCADNSNSCKTQAQINTGDNKISFLSFTSTRGWGFNDNQPVNKLELEKYEAIKQDISSQTGVQTRKSWGFNSNPIFIPKRDRLLGEAWSAVRFYLQDSYNKEKISDELRNTLLKSFLEAYPEMNYNTAEVFKGGSLLWQKDKAGNLISEAKKSGQTVVVYLDNYTEFADLPTLSIKNIAQEIIQAGADMVVHTNADSSTGVEFFNGKPIVYNLGNFLHQSREDELNYSNLVRTIWSKDKLVGAKLIPITTKDNKVSVLTPRIGNVITASTIENSLNLHTLASNLDSNSHTLYRERIEPNKESSIPNFAISNGFLEFAPDQAKSTDSSQNLTYNKNFLVNQNQSSSQKANQVSYLSNSDLISNNSVNTLISYSNKSQVDDSSDYESNKTEDSGNINDSNTEKYNLQGANLQIVDLTGGNYNNFNFVKNEFGCSLFGDSDTDEKDSAINSLFEIQGKNNLGLLDSQKVLELPLSPIVKTPTTIKSRRLIPTSYNPEGFLRIKIKHKNKEQAVPIKVKVDSYNDYFSRSSANFAITKSLSKKEIRALLERTDSFIEQELIIKMDDLNLDQNYPFNKINLSLEFDNPIDKATNLIINDLKLETVHPSLDTFHQYDWIVTPNIINNENTANLKIKKLN